MGVRYPIFSVAMTFSTKETVRLKLGLVTATSLVRFGACFILSKYRLLSCVAVKGQLIPKLGRVPLGLIKPSPLVLSVHIQPSSHGT